jgi:hypothetical protein
MAKARLVAMCRRGIARPDGGRTIVEGAYPLSRWTREEILNVILDVEFPSIEAGE